MPSKPRAIDEVQPPKDGEWFSTLSALARPVVVRGAAAHWPLVQSSLESAQAARNYLLGFYQGAEVTAFVGDADGDPRIFYSDDLSRTNFTPTKTTLDAVLTRVLDSDDAQTVYMGSMALDYCLPGISDANRFRETDVQATVRIWLGNETRVAAHYDVMENIACVCAGRRRFTLFPPEQIDNLYVGPLDFTPAGQSVSLADPTAPNYERFPRFETAMQHALTAELAPGDAIYMPPMWWHHVEGLEPFNILINHWWRNTPAYLGAPGDALLHAMLSIRDLPPAQRQAWRHLFEHYVFDNNDDAFAHIPASARGVLAPLDDDAARQLRALLRQKLAR